MPTPSVFSAHDALATVEVHATDVLVEVGLRGEFDCSNTDLLIDTLRPLPLRSGAMVVIDFKGVTFMDASMLTAIDVCRRRLDERGGSVALTNPSAAARHVFETVGVDVQ